MADPKLEAKARELWWAVMDKPCGHSALLHCRECMVIKFLTALEEAARGAEGLPTDDQAAIFHKGYEAGAQSVRKAGLAFLFEYDRAMAGEPNYTASALYALRQALTGERSRHARDVQAQRPRCPAEG